MIQNAVASIGRSLRLIVLGVCCVATLLICLIVLLAYQLTPEMHIHRIPPEYPPNRTFMSILEETSLKSLAPAHGVKIFLPLAPYVIVPLPESWIQNLESYDVHL